MSSSPAIARHAGTIRLREVEHAVLDVLEARSTFDQQDPPRARRWLHQRAPRVVLGHELVGRGGDLDGVDGRSAAGGCHNALTAAVEHQFDTVQLFTKNNNQWLATSLSHIGRARDAIAVARNLVDQPRDPAKNGKNDGGSPQRSGRARWSEVLTRYELWDDLIAATSSGALDWSSIPLEQKEKAYTLGQAYAAQHDAAKLAGTCARLTMPFSCCPSPDSLSSEMPMKK